MTTNHPVPTPPPSEPAPSLRPVEEIAADRAFYDGIMTPQIGDRLIADIIPLLARLRAAEETLAAVRDRLERSDWIVARELLRLVDASARCRHCGALPDSDGDHSCSCPNPDSTCAEHPVTEGAFR